MALNGITGQPYAQENYVNLGIAQRAQLNMLLGIVIQAKTNGVNYADLISYLFDVGKQPADSPNKDFVEDLHPHISSHPMQLSIVTNMLNLHHSLAARILLMDVIRFTYCEDETLTFWKEHDAVRTQLFACYQATDDLLAAYAAYGKESFKNHNIAMILPALAYTGAALLYIATPLIFTAGLFTAGFGVSVIDTALTTIASVLIAQSTMTLIVATALTVGVTFLAIYAASYLGEMIKGHLNQKSYDIHLSSEKTALNTQCDNLLDLEVGTKALQHYSIFTERTANYMKSVDQDANRKLVADGIYTDRLPGVIWDEESEVEIDFMCK